MSSLGMAELCTSCGSMLCLASKFMENAYGMCSFRQLNQKRHNIMPSSNLYAVKRGDKSWQAKLCSALNRQLFKATAIGIF